MPKKYKVVDAQFHHLPLDTARKAVASGVDDLLKGRVEHPNLTWQRTFDLDGAVRHMDECGVDAAIVQHPVWIASGLPFCRSINDNLAAAVKKYPGRLLPCAHVPYLEGQPAIDELDRAVNVLGFRSVVMLTSMKDVTLDDPRLKPLFKKVVRLGIPVVVHPTTKMPLWGGVKYNMSGSVSREYEIAKSFVEVMTGVLPEFPELNFVFAHYGGGVPFLLGRIMSWHDPEKAPDKQKVVGEPPRTMNEFEESQYKDNFDALLDRVYFDLAGTGGWTPALHEALMVIKPERLCFATDYPHELARPADLKPYIKAVKALELPEKAIAGILGENMLKLLGVK